MPTIFNGTPHSILIYDEKDVYEDAKTRKLYVKDPKARPLLEIPPAGEVLNARIVYRKAGIFEGIPIYEAELLGADPIPEADIVVVSALFAAAAKEFNLSGLERLYTISQPVYRDPGNPRPVGCLGFSRVMEVSRE